MFFLSAVILAHAMRFPESRSALLVHIIVVHPAIALEHAEHTRDERDHRQQFQVFTSNTRQTPPGLRRKTINYH